MKKRNHIGSSLDDFLKEEGILEETRAAALKEALAWQVQKAMKKAKINKVEIARRMHTSRAALDRLLNPGNASVTLQTLCKAAWAVGRDLRIELPERFDGEGHAAQHTFGARDELAAGVPIGDDGGDRRQVVERFVLVERRADEIAQLVLMIGKSKETHSSKRSRRAERAGGCGSCRQIPGDAVARARHPR